MDDPHVAAVTRHLPSSGTVVIDAASCPETLLELRPDLAILRDLAGVDVTLGPDNPCRGWVRRFAPADWDAGARLGGHRAAVLAARLGVLGAVLRDPAVEWLAPVDRLIAAENKVVQYRAAVAVGMRVPATAVGPSATALAEHLGDPFLLKPLGPGSYSDDDGVQRVVYAHATAADELAGADMLDAPFLAQTLLRARTHLRIVTVKEQAWTAAADATGLPVDWRANKKAHRSFAVRDEPEAAAGAIALARALGVGFSSQDWIVDEDGHMWFVDLNPGGQWLFLPSAVAEAATGAVAEWTGEHHCR